MVAATLDRSAEAAALFMRQPVLFVRHVLGAEPDPWQIEALEALAAGKSVAVRSGHGVGKSTLESWVILWFLATRPNALVPCTAPTEEQLSRVLWAELARWLERSPLKQILEWRPTSVVFRGREAQWFAIARTSNRPENLAGFHARHVLYVADEASGIADELYQVIEGALTTEGSLLLMCGNPTRATGYFVDAFGKNREFFHPIHVSSEGSPRVSKQWVADMAKKWGTDSDVYRVRVQGLPPRAEADTFISLELAERAAAAQSDVAPGDLPGPVELGVDVARYGDSETVIIARRGPVVLDLRPYRKRDTQAVAGLVLRCAREWMERTAHPVARIKVDDSGVGGGVTDALGAAAREDPRLAIVPCNFGGAGDENYANATGLMWGALRERLQEAPVALTLPNDPDLLGQLATRKYRVDARGRIALESKEEMRKRGVVSPDRADALALAFFEPGATPFDDKTIALLQGATMYG